MNALQPSSIRRQIAWSGLPTPELVGSLRCQEMELHWMIGMNWPIKTSRLWEARPVSPPKAQLTWQERLVWESPGLYTAYEFIEIGEEIVKIGVEHPTTEGALGLAEDHPFLSLQGQDGWFFNPISGQYDLE